MTPSTITEWLQFLNAGGVPVIILVVLWGGFKRWWVYGWQYDQMRADRDLLQNSHDRAITVADKALRMLDEEGAR